MYIYICLVFILVITIFQLWFVNRYGIHGSLNIEHIEKVIILIKEKSIKSKILFVSLILQISGGIFLFMYPLFKIIVN